MIREVVGVLRVSVVGLAAGTAALALDLLLVRWTAGFPLPVGARYFVAYCSIGIVLASLIAAARRLGGSPADDRRLFALSMAMLYAIPVGERAHYAAAPAADLIAGLAVAGVIGGYLIWIAILSRVAGSATIAALLAALTAASALAINRSLLERAISPAAVGVNLGLLAGSSFLALLVGRRHRHRLRAQAGAAATVLAGVVVLSMLAISVAGRAGVGRETVTADPQPPQPSSNNFLLIVVDTLRADVFWSVLESTEEGRAFRERMRPAARLYGATAVAPWTVPSMGSLLTGLYPEEHGFIAPEGMDRGGPLQTLHPAIETMAETLAWRGYYTEAVVTNPSLHPASGVDRGFERYALLSGPTVKLPLATAMKRLGLLPRDFYLGAAAVRRQFRAALGRVREEERPFFVWLHLMDPHDPLKAHRELSQEPGEEDLEGLELLYRREVRHCLGELTLALDQLESHGLMADTTVVFTSDHGEMFPSDRHRGGTPKTYGHGHALYEELVGVPLMIRQPRLIESELESGSLISQVDLYGSLPELLAIRPFPDPNPERHRIVELLRAEEDRRQDAPGRRYALSGSVHLGPQQRSLRTPRYKLIEPLEGARGTELYDLIADPGELRDLSAERPKVVQALRQSLHDAVAEHRTPPSDIEAADRELLEQLRTLGYIE